MADPKTDTSGQQVQPRMITHFGDGATALTNRDISADLAKLVATPDTVTIYNVAVTGANTEYSQVLPANTKRFMVHLRDNAAFRLAFVTGKVATPTAPYFSVPANMAYSEDGINPAASTLYFASAVATKTAEIIAWS